jgi:hypothetical protein
MFLRGIQIQIWAKLLENSSQFQFMWVTQDFRSVVLVKKRPACYSRAVLALFGLSLWSVDSESIYVVHDIYTRKNSLIKSESCDICSFCILNKISQISMLRWLSIVTEDCHGNTDFMAWRSADFVQLETADRNNESIEMAFLGWVIIHCSNPSQLDISEKSNL